jgi:hypothetical protein
MSVLDRLRVAGWRSITSGDNAIASAARAVNDKLGRPLASADELADRRAFVSGYQAAKITTAPTAPTPATGSVAAPVIVYFLDKQKRDVPRLTEILDGQNIPYQLLSLEDDAAAQAAVRRDSKGFRLPLVFVAGDCIGGRVELVNLVANGGLKRKVYGAG